MVLVLFLLLRIAETISPERQMIDQQPGGHMLQTLTDVVGQRDLLLAELLGQAETGSGLHYFDSTAMDGIVVLDDQIAKRYLEQNYTWNTHIAPHRLPGVGLSIGDIVVHEQKTYLTLHLGVMIANVSALHFMREHDVLYVEWQERRDEANERVRGFIEQVRSLDGNCFGFDQFQRFEHLTSPVGWSDVGTPSPEFVKAVGDLSNLLMKRRRKGMKPLARIASAIVRELEPYSVFQSFMSDLRKEVDHKGFPRVREGMIRFNTPAASGGSTMHTYNPSDDVADVMPSSNDLFMIAAQAGNMPGVHHIGGGTVRGEHYWMLPPRTPFFPMIQERVDNDLELNRLWSEVAQFTGSKEERFHRSAEWVKATRAIKGDVVKEVVPDLIGQRVLGFHVDMNSRRGTALLRPVVADAHYQRHSDVVEQNSLQVIRPSFAALLVEDHQGYGELPSVFGSLMVVPEPPQEAAPVEPALPKVLIVEDEADYHKDYAKALAGKVQILEARSVEDGERLFAENPDVSLIIMDACVPGDEPTTPPLIRKIRETFTGPIIAASSDYFFRQQLMRVGCDHESPKDFVPAKVVALLKL